MTLEITLQTLGEIDDRLEGLRNYLFSGVDTTPERKAELVRCLNKAQGAIGEAKLAARSWKKYNEQEIG